MTNVGRHAAAHDPAGHEPHHHFRPADEDRGLRRVERQPGEQSRDEPDRPGPVRRGQLPFELPPAQADPHTREPHEPEQQRHRTCDQAPQQQCTEDRVERIDGILDADGGRRGEFAADRLGQPGIVGECGALGQRHRREQVVRGTRKRVGRVYQHEIERQALPLHLAQVGDAGREVASQNVDGDEIADRETQVAGEIALEGDQRLAIVAG